MSNLLLLRIRESISRTHVAWCRNDVTGSFPPALRLHVGTCHLVGWGLETNTCVWRWIDNAIWLRCPDRQRSDGLEGSQCFSPFPAPPPLPEPIVEGQGRQNSVDLTIMATKPWFQRKCGKQAAAERSESAEAVSIEAALSLELAKSPDLSLETKSPSSR